MFGFGKKGEAKEAFDAACAREAVVSQGAASSCAEGRDCDRKDGSVREVKVLGTGCRNCHRLFENVQAAVAQTGTKADLEHVTDIERVMGYGVMSTPALVVDGRVVSSGTVLTPAEVAAHLR